MKVYVGKDVNINKYFELNNIKGKLIRFDNYSIDKLESFVDSFLKNHLNKNEKFILYNTCVMDYLPTDIIYYVDDELNEYQFSEYFKEKLSYMYPGEILYNMH